MLLVLGPACASTQVAPSNAIVPMAEAPLVLFNESAEIICYIHVTPSAETEQWTDLLDVDQVLVPGEERRFDVAHGPARLELLDCNRDPLLVREQLELSESGLLIRFRQRE